MKCAAFVMSIVALALSLADLILLIIILAK